ncbi:TPA: hypothetical protein KDY52_004427 [Vibrio parahaemolyticus]|uniref:hypothetical protein n=1 Tax=Vibrio parahaemolyticus TaxID=670 RepID=UPI00041909D5|nr:hypothetical protein [Vibrio parahaemolyticus]EMA2438118.1 hypothetical protein [Vibrio parahaemolyticus]MBE3866980.1 hypothetical protein [Vibrio parahaemolyticus]MCZ5879894.1 hypothetical protein [Vibrio parahaemolyticus]MCZ6371927.1 hypothetical protein [Vibrio parahaemolyticus]MDG3049608.1 hypothetical protein [Vibrio parahaemolyticus]
MKTRNSSFMLTKFGANIFFWVSIGVVLALAFIVLLQIKESNYIQDLCSTLAKSEKEPLNAFNKCMFEQTNGKGSDPLRFISIVSFAISAITLFITNFIRLNASTSRVVHTYYHDVHGSSRLVIHNTSEHDLSVIGIYLDGRTVHNSARVLLHIEENKSIELLLKDSHLRALQKENPELLLTTTSEQIKSYFFKRPNRFGKAEVIADEIDQDQRGKEKLQT